MTEFFFVVLVKYTLPVLVAIVVGIAARKRPMQFRTAAAVISAVATFGFMSAWGAPWLWRYLADGSRSIQLM